MGLYGDKTWINHESTCINHLAFLDFATINRLMDGAPTLRRKNVCWPANLQRKGSDRRKMRGHEGNKTDWFFWTFVCSLPSRDKNANLTTISQNKKWTNRTMKKWCNHMTVGQYPTNDGLKTSRNYSSNCLGPHMQNHSLQVNGLYRKKNRSWLEVNWSPHSHP